MLIQPQSPPQQPSLLPQQSPDPQKPRIKSIQLTQHLQKLSQINKKHSKNQIRIILTQRKKKQKQFTHVYLQDLQQQSIKPTNSISRIFSHFKPINTHTIFLDQKHKNKLLISDRAFSKQPNIISGSYRYRFPIQTLSQQKQLTNRKFQDYDQIVTQQTGPLRLLLKKKSYQLQTHFQKKPIYCKLNKTSNLFSTFQSSKLYSTQFQSQTINSNFSFKSNTYTTIQPSVGGSKQYAKDYKKKINKNFSHFTNSSLSKMTIQHI